MSSIRDELKEQIKNNPVFVVSKTTCPFCSMAKDALKQAGCPEPFVLELNRLDGKACAEIQNVMAEWTGARTVPRVFIGEQCIGGGDECRAKARSGELAKLVSDAMAKKPEGGPKELPQES